MTPANVPHMLIMCHTGLAALGLRPHSSWEKGSELLRDRQDQWQTRTRSTHLCMVWV